MIQEYYLTSGSPNVYDVLSNINALTSVYMTTSYNRITNNLLILERMHKHQIIIICIIISLIIVFTF